MQPQTLGDGQHDLAMGHGQYRTSSATCRAVSSVRFLVAGRAGATLLAGIGHEHLVPANRRSECVRTLRADRRSGERRSPCPRKGCPKARGKNGYEDFVVQDFEFEAHNHPVEERGAVRATASVRS